jgi:amino acid transporter
MPPGQEASMSTAMDGIPVPIPSGAATGGEDKGLRKGTLGLLSLVVIGVSSTAPGYSIAATLGFVVAIVGFQAPAVMLLAFIPMLFIAYAYRELNSVVPDCGTTFTWATKAFGPITGWMGGWGIIAADVIVMASLAQVAGTYGFLLFGAKGLAASTFWVTVVGVLWIVGLTYISYRGIEVSARLQYVLLVVEIIALVIFAVVALFDVYTGRAPASSVDPSLSWFNPLKIGGLSEFSGAILLAVFIYWGWDTAVAVNEEAEDAKRTPGRAAIISTLLLLAIYAIVSVSAISYSGAQTISGSDDVLAVLGNEVLGSTLGKIVIFAVLTSAAASTQTTILPTARTTLSMAAYEALPPSFARIHPKFLTPSVSTIAMGVVSIAFYVGLVLVSSTVLSDSASAVGLLIAFYYGLTGFACAWVFRKHWGSGIREFSVRILLPLLGGLMLLAAFVKTAIDDFNPANSDSVFTFFGVDVGGIFVISVGSLLLGVVLMFVMKVRSPGFFAGSVLSRDTDVAALTAEPTEGLPVLPDSMSQEVFVEPPLTVEQLREAEAEAREQHHREHGHPHDGNDGPTPTS